MKRAIDDAAGQTDFRVRLTAEVTDEHPLRRLRRFARPDGGAGPLETQVIDADIDQLAEQFVTLENTGQAFVKFV